MSNLMVRVNNLSKRYRIGAAEEGYKTIREAIMGGLSAPLRNLSRLRNLTRFKNGDEEDVIWALRDISFEVNEGEVLGIIGKNGAGKTTILKILSRITEPTSGFAEMHGRVSSLLEVGTGFHPELTGRENIFLNGAILGMRKREIEEKFDDIVSFAELEKFIDTAVKRYSSGMYVRLAFAVAAHLEPEILLIDEVLAVGDIAFQKKCLGKIEDVARAGRTVLFVSHNMGAIRSLCESAIWLDNGQIVKKGPIDEVVRDYEEQQLRRFDEYSCVVTREPTDVKGKPLYLSQVQILNSKGERTNVFRYNETLTLLVDLCGEEEMANLSPEFYIYSDAGQLVSVGASGPYHGKYFSPSTRKFRIDVGPLILTSGKYRITLSLVTNTRADTWESAVTFTIIECQPFETHWDMLTFKDGACVLQQSFSAVE